MSEPLTTQQQLLLDQQLRMLEARNQAGDQLDNKASTVLQSGSLIIALVTAVSLPTFLNQQQQPLTFLALAFALAIFGAMVVCSFLAWRPQDYFIPGALTWESMWDNYINATEEEAYRRVLSNLLKATDVHTRRNERKARYVKWATWLLVAQVVGILVIALLSSL